MSNPNPDVIPRVLAIQAAALRISKNGYGTTREWLDELMDAAKSGAIPIHEYLNGQTVPWIVSTVKSEDVRKYLVEQHGVDLLVVKSDHVAQGGGAASNVGLPLKEDAPNIPIRPVKNAGPRVMWRKILEENLMVIDDAYDGRADVTSVILWLRKNGGPRIVNDGGVDLCWVDDLKTKQVALKQTVSTAISAIRKARGSIS